MKDICICTSVVARALTGGSKVKSFPDSEGSIMLISLLHISRTPFHHKLVKAFAIVDDVTVDLQASMSAM